MDPEALQDFEKRQARISNIQSSLQSGDLKSGCVCKICTTSCLTYCIRFSALMAAADEDTSGSAAEKQDTKASPSGLKHRGGKNKRR